MNEVLSLSSLLAGLRWDVDSLITNYEGKRVWLKACTVAGVRVGITDCCLAENPCSYHEALSEKDAK